ncbi:MAG: alpha/beta fold hydrolase [Candidatus Acidiferrales bacterium]
MDKRKICTVALLVCMSAVKVSSQSLSDFSRSNGPLDTSAPGVSAPSASAPSDESAFLKTVTDEHGFAESSDGACLFYRFWAPANGAEPKHIVLVLHGIGLHSGDYKPTALELNKAGIAVYAMDTRGHGLSCGKRANVPEPATETGDIAIMLDKIHRLHPHAELFLLGESMGAIFALNYAKANTPIISGLILLSPVVSVNPKQYEQIRMWRYLPDFLFFRDKPDIDLAGRGTATGKADVQADATSPADPLEFDKISVNYILELRRNKAHWTDTASQVRVPTLIMKGDLDQVSSSGSARRLFNLIATTDKEYESYPNLEHSLLSSSEAPDILNSVSAWIDRH